MGKPARTQPTVTARRDGSTYSSHRVHDPTLPRDVPRDPTPAANALHRKQVDRDRNRRAKLARRNPERTR